MNKHEIASLASKLAGLYAMIHSLGYLSVFGVHLSLTASVAAQANTAFVFTLTTMCFVFTLGLGLLLFIFSDKFATILLGRKSSTVESAPARIENIQLLALSLIGLYLTLQALPGFIKTILTIWFSYEGWTYRSAIRTEIYLDLVTDIVQIGIGIWLLVGSFGVARIVNKIRGGMN